MKIEIPLPFGGKSSKDLKMFKTVWTPALNFKSVGFYLPPREFQVPTFAIPRLYPLQVPLLGVLDLSANVYSNLYNWSASYTGGNTSTDHLSLQAQYHMKADSVVDLLSYSVQGELRSRRGCTELIHCRFQGQPPLQRGKLGLSYRYFSCSWKSTLFHFSLPLSLAPKILTKHTVCIEYSSRQ